MHRTHPVRVSRSMFPQGGAAADRLDAGRRFSLEGGRAAPRDEDSREADRALLERMRRGDETAFAELLDAFGGRLLATATRLTGSAEEGADAVQDGLLSAFQAVHAFRGDARLGTWLHRIVVNASLMRIRSKKRRERFSLVEMIPHFDDENRAAEAAARRGGPLEEASRSERRARIRQAVEQLPDAYRTVLVLRDLEERDTAQTAALLGVSDAVVKTRLHRARQALRPLLAPLVGDSAA